MLRRQKAEPTQGREPPLAEHAFGGLRANVEGALDGLAIVREDRAVAEGDVDLLERQAPREKQLHVLDPGRPAGPDLVVHRPDRGPDLAPSLAARRPEHGGVLGLAEEGDVGIVVDEPQLRPEPEEDRERRVEAEPHRRLDRGGPGLRRPERGGRPVLGRASARRALPRRLRKDAVCCPADLVVVVAMPEPLMPSIGGFDTNVTGPAALSLIMWHPTGPTTARSNTSQVQTPTAGIDLQRIEPRRVAWSLVGLESYAASGPFSRVS